MRKRQVTKALMAFMLCCLLLSLPASVSAHAYIVASSPGENEVLEQAPAQVSITFNEPIEKAFHSIQVTDPSGEQVTQGESRIDNTNSAQVIADLRPDLPNGVYTVNYKVLSSDGHTVTGTFPFIIGEPAAAQNPAIANELGSSLGQDWPKLSLLLVRWLQYSGLAMIMGVLLFHLLLLPRRLSKDAAADRQQTNLNPLAKSQLWQQSKRLLVLSLLLAAAGIGLSLPQQTASDAGIPWSQAWNPLLISDTLSLTSFGKAWAAEIILLVLLAGMIAALFIFMSKQNRWGADLTAAAALLATLGILLAKSFIGHAAAASERSMAITMNFLHQASSFLWLGGLLSLALFLPAAAEPLRNPSSTRRHIYWEAIRRFSILAAGCVAILLCSGVYAGLLHIPTWHALLHSSYGLILLAKGGLTLVMLVLGFSAFLRGRKQTRPLGRGVWLEFVTGLIVLVLAAVLSNMPTALSSPGPLQLKAVTTEGYHLTVEVSPNTIGENRFGVTALNQDGKPVEGIEQITLTLTSVDMEMGTIELTIPGGSNSPPFSGNTIVTMGGSWRLHVHILLSSLNTINSSFTFQVGNK